MKNSAIAIQHIDAKKLAQLLHDGMRGANHMERVDMDFLVYKHTIEGFEAEVVTIDTGFSNPIVIGLSHDLVKLVN